MLAVRADATTRWRIAERAAPSPRAYERLAEAWVHDWLRAVYAALRAAADAEGVRPGADLTPSTGAAVGRRLSWALAHLDVPPPDARVIEVIGRPAVRAGLGAAHRELVAAGMPRDWLVRRSGLLVPSSLRVDEAGDTPSAMGRLGLPGGPTEGIDILMSGPGEQLLRTWVGEGVDLIRTLARRQTAALPDLVVQTIAQGGRWETLVETVEQMGARSASHARLIARDQVAKINGRITQDLHAAAGVRSFRLRTSEDERVRERHREAATDDIGHGPGVYLWSEGIPDFGFYGETSWPGQAGQCRCGAEPVIEDNVLAQWAAAAG